MSRPPLASVIVATAVAAALLTAAPSASAVSTVTAKRFATNSDAASLSDQWNRSLHDLAIVDGELYSTWGSYDNNVGPIALNSHQLASGAQTRHVVVDGEELDALRVSNGKLYTADVDPKASWTSNAGFAANRTGNWSYSAATPFIHVFDVAVLGSEIFLAGSIVNPDPAAFGPAPYLAAIKKSADGGKTWSIVKTRSSRNGSTEQDRYYWLAVAGGKLHASATVVDQYGVLNRVVDVYANGKWSTLSMPTAVAARVTDAHTVVSFGTKVVGKTGNNGVWVYDTAAKGKPSTQSVTLGTTGGRLMDFYVDGGTIYALVRGDGTASNDTVYLSKDARAWSPVMTVDIPVPNWLYTWNGGSITTEMRATATSIAVKDGIYYFGTNMGDIYRAAG